MIVLFVVNMEDLGFEEPLGPLYLSAVAKKRGHRIYAVENDAARIEARVRELRPDLIAASVLTPSFPYLVEAIRRVRKTHGVPTVFGGPHATFFPEIIQDPAIDYVFVGESEGSFADFLDALEAGRPASAVSNLVMKEREGRTIRNALRPLVDDLDSLPFPDRELFAGYPQFYRADVRSIIASRGCPYQCTYCFNDQFRKLYAGLGSTVRLRSVDNVIAECLELKHRYRAKMIHFFDDIFPFQKEWLSDFTEQYSRMVGLPFLTNTRFNVCTEEYVGSLSRAGCRTLLIGVETGNEELREKILNRRMSNELMIEKSRIIHRHGIRIYTQNLIGLPYGGLDKDLETLKLNIDLEADYAGAYLCQPYPKTEIERMARQAGLIDETATLSRSFYHASPLKLEDRESIERLRVLFSIIVSFPALYRHVRRLLGAPMLPMKIISSLLHGYKIKTVILRYPMSIGAFIRNLVLFFRRRINSAFSPEVRI